MWFGKSFRQWLSRRRSPIQYPQKTGRNQAKLKIELLEDRLAPATLIFDTATSEFTSGVPNQGWWTAAGASVNTHSPGDDSYYTGTKNGELLRSFFTFDLSTLDLTGKVITSATLNINSADISATNPTLGFWNVSTAALALSLDSGTSTTIFDDLGTGTNYGDFPVTDTQSGQLLSFALNSSAVADITAGAGSYFSVGGAIASPGAADFVFSNSGLTTQHLVLEVADIATLSATLDGAGNLTIADTTGVANDITVGADSAGNYVITDANEQFTTPLVGALTNGNKTLTILKSSVTGHLIFDTADGTDTLTVDYGRSGGFFTTPILFHGGGNNAGDGLIVTGGSFDMATHSFTTTVPGNSGTLVYDVLGDGTQTDTINYDGLAPVNMTGSTISNLVFNLPAVASNAFLEDDGITGNGISQLRSGLGVFETTTFANPTLGGSVTINGDVALDTLTVKALPDFTQALSIDSAIDTVNLNANLTLASLDDQAGANVVNTASVTIDTSAGNGAITIANSIDDANALPTNALVLKAGTGVVLLPAVGASAPLLSLQSTTTGAGSTTLNDDVSANDVTLSGDVTLGGNVNITYDGIAALSISGGTVSLGVHTLTLTDMNATDTGTISDIISDSGKLVKQGTGTLTLSAVNDYTGKTTIGGGTLALSNTTTNNNIASSTTIDVQSGAILDASGLGTGGNAGRLDLASGQTLQGEGKVSGAVKALSGSHIAPGESPGILSVSSMNFKAGATFNVEINGVGTLYDQLKVNGTVTIDTTAPGVSLSIALGYVPIAGQTYTILNKVPAGPLSGRFLGQPQGHIFTVSGKRFGILYNGGAGKNDIVVHALDVNSTFYVDDSWVGLDDGTVITDADPVLAGLQAKVIGIDAFSAISDGLTAVGDAGATDLFVLNGTYSEAVSLPAGVTMHVVGGTPSNPGPIAVANGSVTVSSLASAFASATVDLGYNSPAHTGTLVTGDATSTSFAGTISGASGNLTKQGVGKFTLSGTNSYTGVTTVSGGTLQVTSSLSNTTGEVDLTGADVVLDGDGTGQVLRPIVVTGAGAQITKLTVNTMSAALDGITIKSGADNVIISNTKVTGSNNGINANDVSGLQLTDDTVTNNSGDGVVGTALKGTTTISGGTFGDTGVGNGGNGLNLTGDNLAGTNLILTNAVTANHNTTDGLVASKFPGLGATAGVSITGATFSNNSGDGIDVSTVTKLAINGVNAKSNLANGLDAASLSGANTVTNSHFELNARGIKLAGGSLTTTTTTISTNKGAGDGAGALVTSGSLTLDTGTSVNDNETTAGSGGGVAFESAGTLTIQSATTTILGNKAKVDGGGIYISAGTATIQDNVAIGGATIADQNKANGNGGGIHASGGSVTLQNNVKVQGNNAVGSGGGVNVAGAIVTFLESLLPGVLFFNSTPAGVVSGNSAANGGGLNVSSGTLNLDVTTVSGNSALTTTGGGLNGTGGIVNVTNSTFSGNSAATSGGGLSFSGGADSITNVTVSKNTAGGGMAVSGAAVVTLTNDTFAFNTGDGVTQIGGTVTSANSLFASNTGKDFNGTIAVNAVAAKNGNNLFQSSTGATGTVASDVLDKPARLEDLGTFGGPTQTHALLPGSFALDTGKVTSTANDQRGLARSGSYDIGAYESQGFTVTRMPDNETPANGDTKYRGLVGTDFLNDDGLTPTVFKVGVVANDSLLTNLKGGVLTFLATSGAVGDTANPHTASTTLNTIVGPYTAQTTVQANLIASLPGVLSFYDLIATANPNVSPKAGTDTAPGPNNTDWLLFNQQVTTLRYSGQPQNTTQNATAVSPQPPSPIQFVPAGATKTSFTITMQDQELHTVKVANLPVAIQSYLGDAKTFASTAVNVLPNAITFATPHAFTTGQALVYDNGTGIDITGAAKSSYLFTSANVNSSALVNTITFSAPHGLKTGQALTYQNGGGAGMAGLTNSLTYYAIVVNPTTIKLALNPAAATLGTAIKLGSIGNAVAQSLTPTYYAIVVNASTIRLAINQVNAKNLVSLPLLNLSGASQSLAPTGAINTATGNGLTAANTLSGAINSGTTIVSTTTLQPGVALFKNANLKIYTSYITPYHLQALYTNPNGQSVALDHGSSNPFTVLPMSLAITGGNFAGFGQRLYNIIIVQSDRGPVRLVNVTEGQNNLKTNQVKIEAFDYSLIGGKSIAAIYYNGPVVLTSSVPVTPALKPFYMLSGGSVLVTLTPVNAFGEFTLEASTSVLGASPGIGALTVSTKTSGGTGNFIRFNIGRQRGR